MIKFLIGAHYCMEDIGSQNSDCTFLGMILVSLVHVHNKNANCGISFAFKMCIVLFFYVAFFGIFHAVI